MPDTLKRCGRILRAGWLVRLLLTDESRAPSCARRSRRICALPQLNGGSFRSESVLGVELFTAGPSEPDSRGLLSPVAHWKLPPGDAGEDDGNGARICTDI